MMRQMLQWRKDNKVDAIREDIMRNQKFHPRSAVSNRQSLDMRGACKTCTCRVLPTLRYLGLRVSEAVGGLEG